MDAEQKTTEKNGCCAKGHCCGCKAAAAVVLLLLGGVIGYFGGRCGRGCAMPAANTPSQPQSK